MKAPTREVGPFERLGHALLCLWKRFQFCGGFDCAAPAERLARRAESREQRLVLGEA